MTERRLAIELLLADAAECELIGSLAADPEKRRVYRLLARDFRAAADQFSSNRIEPE